MRVTGRNQCSLAMSTMLVETDPEAVIHGFGNRLAEARWPPPADTKRISIFFTMISHPWSDPTSSPLGQALIKSKIITRQPARRCFWTRDLFLTAPSLPRGYHAAMPSLG